MILCREQIRGSSSGNQRNRIESIAGLILVV